MWCHTRWNTGVFSYLIPRSSLIDYAGSDRSVYFVICFPTSLYYDDNIYLLHQSTVSVSTFVQHFEGLKCHTNTKEY